MMASFVPGRAVIAMMRCAPERATNGYWMKKGLRLSAGEMFSLIGSFIRRCEERMLPTCRQHAEPSVFPRSSEVTPDSQIRNLKLYEIN